MNTTCYLVSLIAGLSPVGAMAQAIVVESSRSEWAAEYAPPASAGMQSTGNAPGRIGADPVGDLAQDTSLPAAELLPPDAQELVQHCATDTEAIQSVADRQIRERRKKLMTELRPLQDKYTREAKLDEAVAIRDLIRALQASVATVVPDPGARVQLPVKNWPRPVYPRYRTHRRVRLGHGDVHERFHAGHRGSARRVAEAGANRSVEGHRLSRTGPLRGIDPQRREQHVVQLLSQQLHAGVGRR